MEIHFSKEDIYDIIVRIYFGEMAGSAHIKEHWNINWDKGDYKAREKCELCGEKL